MLRTELPSQSQPSGEMPSQDEIMTLVRQRFSTGSESALGVYLRVCGDEAKGMPEAQAARFSLLMIKVMELIVRHLHTPNDLELMKQELFASQEYQEYMRLYHLGESTLQQYIASLALGLLLEGSGAVGIREQAE